MSGILVIAGAVFLRYLATCILMPVYATTSVVDMKLKDGPAGATA